MATNHGTSTQDAPPLHEVGRLISVRETCEILGVSVATIDRMVKAGTLHAVRPTGPRGDRKFRIEDVVDIRSRCFAQAEPAA